MKQTFSKIPALLLAWYDKHRRDLPWRALPHQTPNPYHVWLSEIMLQQTTIATVRDYFLDFITTWPTLADLAAAPEDAILAKWSGLGYYSRARNLHKAARVMVEQHRGYVPREYSELMALPGIGDYTASAIRAIAYNGDAAVMDGNVERVVSRLFQIEEPLPKGKKTYRAYVADLSQNPCGRWGDFAQAMMDLGATICTPKSPKCSLCPLNQSCKAFAAGVQTDYPRKDKKKDIPTKYAKAFVFLNKKGEFFMRKRGDEGMLAGLYEIPTSEWVLDKKDIKNNEFKGLNFTPCAGVVRHVFSHFAFEIEVLVTQTEALPSKSGVWVSWDKVRDYGVPTVMKKIMQHVMKAQ